MTSFHTPERFQYILSVWCKKIYFSWQSVSEFYGEAFIWSSNSFHTSQTLTLSIYKLWCKHPLTESGDKLFEVDERVFVLVEQAEESAGQCFGVKATAPGRQSGEELNELAAVDAVLLQIRQTLVVPLRCSAARTPVTTHDVLRLGQTHIYTNNHTITHTITRPGWHDSEYCRQIHATTQSVV